MRVHDSAVWTFLAVIFFFFFTAPAPTDIYTSLIVGSVRCVIRDRLGSGGVFWMIQAEVMSIFEDDGIGCSYSIGIDESRHSYIALLSVIRLGLEDLIHMYPTPGHVHDEECPRPIPIVSTP